jgi:GFO/IDH/MocA oxidoreductase family protein
VILWKYYSLTSGERSCDSTEAVLRTDQLSRSTLMRVVFIGVSHWHLMPYLKPALEISGVEIVGVSDPNPAVAQAAAERARCKAWVDYGEMCGATRPDFAFALGRHCDMAELARFLIERAADSLHDGEAVRRHNRRSGRYRETRA